MPQRSDDPIVTSNLGSLEEQLLQCMYDLISNYGRDQSDVGSTTTTGVKKHEVAEEWYYYCYLALTLVQSIKYSHIGLTYLIEYEN